MKHSGLQYNKQILSGIIIKALTLTFISLLYLNSSRDLELKTF